MRHSFLRKHHRHYHALELANFKKTHKTTLTSTFQLYI